MLLYATVGTNDLEAAGRFYDAVLRCLGYRRQKEAPGEIGYAADDDVRCRFWVVEPFNREPATFGNGVTVPMRDALGVKLNIRSKDGAAYFQEAGYSYRQYHWQTEWDRIGLYKGGQLIWGIEPSAWFTKEKAKQELKIQQIQKLLEGNR